MPLFIPNMEPIVRKTTESENEKNVREYVAKYKPNVAILTPCYGSACFVNFVTCLINTMSLFTRLQIGLKIEFCRNDSLVSRARNNLIAKAMSDPTITHMMFIDADITWNPWDIIKLLMSGKALVGGVYPLKHYDWHKLVPTPGNPAPQKDWIDAKNRSQLKDVATDVETIQQRILRYNINYISSQIEINNNLTRVKHLANGFMLIERGTIEKMMRAFPSTKYTDDVGFLQGEENKYAYALFDCGVEEGHYYSEDWLFCSRWTKMGGDVWIDVSINLMHTGIEDFKGCYINSIMS